MRERPADYVILSHGGSIAEPGSVSPEEEAALVRWVSLIDGGGYCCTPDSGDCCGPGSWCCARAGKHEHDAEEES